MKKNINLIINLIKNIEYFKKNKTEKKRKR